MLDKYQPPCDYFARRASRYADVDLRMGACAVQEAKDMARACCQALKALHDDGIVHRDVRLANVVRLGPRQWMLIDYEHCGKAGAPLPASFRLQAWDGTETEPVASSAGGSPTRHVYDGRSDMVMLGRMLQQACRLQRVSPQCTEFVQKLLDRKQYKKLSAADALLEPWLQTAAGPEEQAAPSR
jgi:hypothetical protein